MTDKGLLPCPNKVETIRQAKAPQNVTELKAFLGLLTFYAKFIPNLSSRISCLYNLLRKDVKYVWSHDCGKVFNECKQMLMKPNLLEYFDPYKPVVVVTDACNYGLGGVISHVVNGAEKPISFVSFSLNDAQKKYPILHLEALAVVSTVKKFHKFLYGMKFTIYTDHKPLIGIFGKEGKHPISITRLQRYVMELAIYDFEIVYRPSSKLGNADFCSRFPLSQEVPKNLSIEYIKNLNFSDEFPINYKEVAEETSKDDFLQTLLQYLRKGWPKRLDRCFTDIFSHYQDLEEVEGCVLFQDRVIVPESMKTKVLKLLHMNHSGINKIKQLARRTVYWFGLNKDVEDFVKSCKICNEMNVVTKKAHYSQWIPTNKPFSRIHADFFYFEKKIFLLVVDSFTKWIEIEHMKYGTDLRKVIKVFLRIFARFGLPDTLVTDGGPPFNSMNFVKFFENQGIKVLKSPPYHPESNGQAERMVRVVKDALKKLLLDPDIRQMDTDEQISYFLFNYRNICLDDKQVPSEKLLSFKPKTLLDLINPKTGHKHRQTTTDRQNTTDNFEPNAKVEGNDDYTKLKSGDLIYYKNFNNTDIRRWLPAKFLNRNSDTTFQISLGGRIILAHKRQLKLPHVKHPRRRKLYLTSEENFSNASSKGECSRNTKRRREEEDEHERISEEEEEFYGFPADSFIYSDKLHEPRNMYDEVPEMLHEDQETHIPQKVVTRRISNRKTKKKRYNDYIYF